MKQLISLAILATLSLSGFAQEICNAYFNVSNYQGSYYFYPYGYGENYTYAWDFGDGTTSTVMNPQIEYITPGVYNVCLHVSNQDLTCDESFCLEITVCEEFSEDNIVVSAIDDDTYSFENLNPEYEVTWLAYPGFWTSTDNPVQHDFIMSDTYEIVAMVSGEPFLFNWVDNQGNVQTYETFCSDSVAVTVDVNLTEYATISGYFFADQNGNGVMDEDEGASPINSPFSIESNGNYFYQYPDVNGYFEIQVAPGSYVVASSIGAYNNYFYGISVPNTLVDSEYYGEVEGYEFTVENGTVLENLNFGVISTQSTISGTVFADENSNGIQDSNEYGVPYHNIYVDGYYAGTTNSEGFYSLTVVSDDHVVSIFTEAEITVPLSGEYEIINPNLGQAFSDFNFGLDVSGADLEAIISWVTPHVPGTYRDIWVDVYNHGVAQEDAVLVLELDPMVEFNYSSIGGVYDELTHSVTWTNDISTLSTLFYYVQVYVSTEAEVGDQVLYTATIDGTLEDGDLSNNISTHQSNVVASYDPNMKQVNPVGELEEGFIESNQEMQYTLHFQNTGNYYAMNVVITDELPLELDPSTIEVISSSHPCTSTFNEGVLRFTFSDIMLPWQAMDEAASQGFVSFRIQQDEDLPVGTTIENEVNIYFDFNDPILTNTTLNTIGDSLDAVLGLNMENISFTLSPVPAQDFLQINWEGKSDKLGIRMFDIIGQEVLFQPSVAANTHLDVKALNSGIYTVQVLDENKVLGTTKFVKQ